MILQTYKLWFYIWIVSKFCLLILSHNFVTLTSWYVMCVHVYEYMWNNDLYVSQASRPLCVIACGRQSLTAGLQIWWNVIVPWFFFSRTLQTVAGKQHVILRYEIELLFSVLPNVFQFYIYEEVLYDFEDFWWTGLYIVWINKHYHQPND